MRGPQLTERLTVGMLRLSGLDGADEAQVTEHALRFEFTLLLAALQVRLDVAMMLWPAVEAALNLESSASLLSRRPPRGLPAAGPRVADGERAGLPVPRR